MRDEAAAITLDRISHAIAGKTILEDVTIRFESERVNILLGPNGAGKSTLLKIAAGRMAPSRGVVRLGGDPVMQLPAGELARRRAFLSQQIDMGFALTVEAVVMMGRYPHFRRAPAREDHRIVGEMLDLVGMAAFRDRIVPTLSGGERQRVHLARVLAQIWQDERAAAARTLFLDEPLGALDIQHQLQLLALVRRIAARRCTVVMTLHDLNVAAEHGDSLFFLREGRLIGRVDRPDPVDEALVRQVFEVGARPLTDAAGHRALRFHL